MTLDYELPMCNPLPSSEPHFHLSLAYEWLVDCSDVAQETDTDSYLHGVVLYEELLSTVHATWPLMNHDVHLLASRAYKKLQWAQPGPTSIFIRVIQTFRYASPSLFLFSYYLLFSSLSLSLSLSFAFDLVCFSYLKVHNC